MEKILNRCRVGCGWQYLVHWLGYGVGSDSVMTLYKVVTHIVHPLAQRHKRWAKILDKTTMY